MTPAKLRSGALAAMRSAPMDRADAQHRETLLRQVLPLWNRNLPDETLALVVATTAQVPTATFEAAMRWLAVSEEKLSFDNPIPLIVGFWRRAQAEEAEWERARKDAAHAAAVAKEREAAARNGQPLAQNERRGVRSGSGASEGGEGSQSLGGAVAGVTARLRERIARGSS